MPPSGPSWVTQFPTSRSVTDLVDPFRTNVTNFLAALAAASATVTISATFRPPQRAYLMYYSFLIGNNSIDPATAPAHDGVDIQWVHLDDSGNPDGVASQQAAAAMAGAYDIVFQPSLTSRHTQALAIDMTISWQGDLTITDANGNASTITSLPRSGANSDLQAIGATYGVIKLATDPPHWSSDGH
jgi:hypothetical protein